MQRCVFIASRALPIMASAAARIVWSFAENAPGFGITPPSCLPIIDERALRQIAEIVREIGVDAR